MRLATLLPAFALLSAAAVPLVGSSQVQRSHCQEFFRREPLVLYDVTGYTFAGILVHAQLSVYDDGLAGVSNLTGDTRAVFLDAAEAGALRSALALAGGTTLCDQQLVASDTPLTTLTLLRGRADASAHTFSYYSPEGEYEAIEQVIDDFIDAHFPGFTYY